VGTGDKAVGA